MLLRNYFHWIDRRELYVIRHNCRKSIFDMDFTVAAFLEFLLLLKLWRHQIAKSWTIKATDFCLLPSYRSSKIEYFLHWSLWISSISSQFMVLLIFFKASNTSPGTSLHKTYKRWNSKNNDDITNALTGIMANDLKLPSIYAVARIRQ